MTRAILGLDIGGANLKAAHTNGEARLQPFALWKEPAGLPAVLRALVKSMPPHELLAVTMTGELCDCFESKRQGVNAILDAVEAVAGAVPVRVWQTEEQFVDVATARATPLRTAAANWLALARFAGRFAPTGAALVIDIGSTTSDIIPLEQGKPAPVGRTDPERLRSQELVYTGVQRTPLCALLGAHGAAELFATTRDVYLWLGALPESDDRDTADGRPASRAAAHIRLARMLCADRETCSLDDIQRLAEYVLHRQVTLLNCAIEGVARQLPHLPGTFILAGAGEFLLRVMLPKLSFQPDCVVSLADKLGPTASQAACAHALATLAAELVSDAS